MPLNIYTDDSSPMSTSDVESFTGKIVCNIDGSSYIIDAEKATLSSISDNSLSVAAISFTNQKKHSILQTTKSSSKSSINSNTSASNSTSKNIAAAGKDVSRQAEKQAHQPSNPGTNPKIHTFRVVSANDANVQLLRENNQFKIQKPILMCFICKLSFGITKSFSLHANTEHGLDLQDLEKHLLMQREYSSAIIQRTMDESPQISFLEPVDTDAPSMSGSSPTEDLSSMERQAGKEKNEALNTVASSTSHKVAISSSNASSQQVTTITSCSSSPPSSSSSPMSLCCTNSSTTTTSTTTTTTCDKSQGISPQLGDDQHSQCIPESRVNASVTSTSTTTTCTTSTTNTLESLNLDKSKTNNNYNISESLADNFSSSSTTTPVCSSFKLSTTSTTGSSSAAIALTTLPTTAVSSPSTLSSSSLTLSVGVDLSTSTGNLATEAISTDSLVNINKFNNDNSNSNNDSIEPQAQDITNTPQSADLSPKSNHLPPYQATSLSSSAMGDFLQQHLHRLTGGRLIANDESQHKNLDNDSMSWPHTAANTFPLPATASNASVAQISSLHASLAALNSEQNTSSVKLISKFLQHQLVAAQQQQQQHHQKELVSNSLNHTEQYLNPATVSTPNTPSVLNVCPEHPNFKGIDCKTCEMLEAHQSYKPSPQVTPQRSPTNSGIAVAAAAAAAAGLGLLTAANQLSMSPNHSLNANNLAPVLNVPLNTPPLSNSSNTSSFTIGACSDHINGRPLGVECARCEMILNSARLNSNVQMSTRNSCKTLKCPQCNWHYKYQETLEIHMREKHPDGESACGYCLAGQQHPRLARGESYSCGYKPYRCEICNYSTTTKGNLSIHMQSDKHLNNMQELNSSQNMVAAAVAVATGSVGKLDATPKINLPNTISTLNPQQQQQQQQQPPQIHGSAGGLSTASCGTSGVNLQSGGNGSSSSVSCSGNKPKPSFRCDICSYETSVARNLRIHMTSEKHTHNMAVLQNNIKHIQALTFLQQQQQQQTQQQQQGNNFMPEVALADLAYNQALMIQLLHQNAAAAAAQAQTHQSGPSSIVDGSSTLMPPSKGGTKLQATSPTATEMALSASYSPKSNDLSSDLSYIEPPIKPDLWPTTLFSCLVCSNFNTNSLDELNQHLMVDRSRQVTHCSNSSSSLSPTPRNTASISLSTGSGPTYFTDIMIFQNNNYICRLCNYKTNLKANYQLHSKTDKHLQKLNFINHLREGGASNEYKLKYYQQQQQQIGANTIQIKCNACDFYTNSIQKLSLHTQHMRHETMMMIFQHLNYLVQQQQTNSDESSINMNSDAAPLSLVDGTTTSTGKPASSSAITAITTVTTSTTTSSSSSSLTLSSPISVTATKPPSTVDCNKSLLCHLCNFKANSLLEMIQHVKSIRHLQVEQFVCLQRRSEQLETPNLDDIFKLCAKSHHNNDSMMPNVTSTSSSNTIDIKSSGSSFCFSNLVESENEDFANKMTFDQAEESENVTNLDNAVNLSALRAQNDNIDKATTSAEATTSAAASSSIPPIIFKCNHCDFFGQIKQEVEVHIETSHPNADNDDIISIPTNPVAIQAFQAAMAAATLAAVSRATKPFQTPSPIVSPNMGETKETSVPLIADDEDKEPVAIKRERLDTVEPEIVPMEIEQGKNVKSLTMEVIESENVSRQVKQQQNIGVQCPLCQDFFTERNALEIHLMKVHSVNKDGLARLLLLVDNSLWKQNDNTSNVSRSQSAVTETASSSSSSKITSDAPILANQPTLAAYELLVCQQCGSSFKHEQQLLQHAQKMQHYTMQQGEYLCLAFNSVRNPCTMHYSSLAAMFNHYNDTHMRLVISERHVYKYRCKQCSLAFKTQEKLATHTLYHTMRDATKCAMCQRNFRSTQALQKHMELTHNQTATNSNSLESTSPITVSPSGSEQEKPTDTSQTVSNNDKFENESSRSITPGQDMCPPTQSPSSNQNDPQNSASPSVQQQQQISALTALINQQQQTAPPSDILHHLQMQHQQFQNLPALHNLQQMQQQLPQFAAAVAASGMPLNPVEMLNLMQFHHLISLNFMNLAPPLIFGGNNTPSNPASSSSVAGSNTTAPINMPNNNASQTSSHVTSADLATSSSATSSNTPQAMAALPNVEVNTQILQQQQISPGASTSQLLNNQKRARTRITDDQLKILRAHFDINNSPSEESILEMSQKANLPMKVVKHWFRNTLFKERQRNKDSPYNFNNPPSTTLNLEEYERTGQAKVIPLTEQVQQQQQQQQLQIPSRPSSAHSISNISEYSNQQQIPQQQQIEQKQREEADTLRSQTSSVASSTFPLDVQIKTEPGEDLMTTSNSISAESSTSTMATYMKHQQQQQKLRFSSMEAAEHDLMMMSDQHLSSAAVVVATAAQQQQHAAAVAASTFYNNYETKSESESSDIHSRPQSPNSNTTSNLYASMNDLLSQQLENMPHNQMGPPKKFQLNTNSNPSSNLNAAASERTAIPGVGSNSGSGNVAIAGGITVSSKLFEKHSPSAQYDTNSNSSNSSTTSSGKRANRTRFTDYQIKVLQEFFENNSYPKDSDLEYLSKLLLLSPRVIVVWFQNARQKQRKIYENQPNNSLYESEEKKQNINYACKKCSLVFQRYYELIRHQKNHCFKEENNKKSAKAQIAAAQIAQNLSSEDSNSSIDINSAAAAALLAQHHPVAGVATVANIGKNTPSGREFSPITCNATTPPAESGNNSEHQKFACDKCKLTFSHFDSLREHQLMHLVNPNLHLPTDVHTTASTAAAAAYGPFGSILQSLQQAAHLQQAAVNAPSAAKKRKYSETSSNADDMSSQGAISLTGAEYENHAKKYNFLYQYFLQNEGNSDLRQQFHNRDSAELNMEFLASYYQQTELKKRNNYEFLFQYYVRNEQLTNVNFELADNKPNIEFLLQYYQLCESKKFFQLEASPQRIYDGPLMQGDFVTTRHNNSSSNNSSRPASNASNSSSPSGSGINEESNGGEVLNNIDNDSSPQLTTFIDTEHKPRSNGQLCNITNNNNDFIAANVVQNDQNHCKDTNDGLKSNNTSKIEEQMDQLDGLQEVNNQLNSNSDTILSESPHISLETTAGSYYQNLEDFLDATMIENLNQTLTFPMESVKLQAEKVSMPPVPSHSKPVCTSQSLEPATSNLDNNSNHKQANKRLRTTILPEQLNFLYECYQNESNPSRKMLEEISKKVSLKKRVVQVWFQNTRAKDKKSRNQQRQHFSNISDDNSNSSSVTNIQKGNISGLTSLSTTAGSETSNDILKDCNLCQVMQVDIQQHAFSIEHIHKVKEIFAQTTAAAATLVNSGVEESDIETYRVHNEDHQKITQQKHQLALMVMALQTQNLSNSTVFNDFEENLIESQTPVERNDDNFSSKPKYQKKSKRNSLKKKKYALKNISSVTNNAADPIATALETENELILNINVNRTDGTHFNANESDKLEGSRRSYLSDTIQNSNEQNDGNNNRNEDVDMHSGDEFVALRSKSSNVINEENGMSKSQLFNYNQTNEY